MLYLNLNILAFISLVLCSCYATDSSNADSELSEAEINQSQHDGILNYIFEPDNEFNSKECAEWNYPDSSKLMDIIFSLKPQVVHETNDMFDTYQCRIKGELIKDDKIYEYYFNAGGYVTLVSGDEKVYFGCEKGEGCEQYFVGRKFTVEEFEKMMNE